MNLPQAQEAAPPRADHAPPAGRMIRMFKSRVEVDEALIERHQTMVWRFLRFLGADPAAAEDLGQETFLRLIQSPPEDRGDAALGAWLRTAARNLFLRQGRRARQQLEFLDGPDLERLWLRWSADQGQGEAYQEALRACLDQLQVRARQALALRYGEEASRQEIAAHLEMTEEGIKTLLRRSRAALQTCIETRLRAGEGDA